ncbi:hypothetical protein B0A48_13697 [Cryoendolithus antarcticus]|uniref:COMPASS component SDC1 n=1 Tax=Cryoendolithus antarcticus TaxID=1507870 RepID=A0A1V8SMP4_9PEZI|nr:hypothetical protein B0A48_13697 [Cryoendolithus antarcticus]
MAEHTPNGIAPTAPEVEMEDSGAVQTSIPPQSIIAEASIPSQTLPSTMDTLPTALPTAPSTATPPRPAGPPTQQPSIPPPPNAKPVPHGGPTRQYLNQNLTPHLLEGMKYIAMYEPEKPLLWLSDFLRDRSRELEGA